MSNKKRNYRKTGQDNDNVANVKRSEDTSIVFSRLSFAGEEVDEDPNLGTFTKTDKLPRKAEQTKPILTTIGGQPSEQAFSPQHVVFSGYSAPSQSTEQIFPLKGARKKLSVTQFLDRGRGVRTDEDIAVGQTILEEVSYVAVIDDRNLSKRCSWCFGADRKLSRCSVCKTIYYCSSPCQKRDWASFHQEECKAFVRVSRPVPTAIRIISRILRKRHGDRQSVSDSFVVQLIFGSGYINSWSSLLLPFTQYAEVENLENRKPDFSLNQLEIFAQMAMVLRDCVSKEAIPSASEIIDLWCKFTTNSFSILDNEMVDVGVGLYPATAMINHSCQPNCVVVFEGPKILVRSIRPIKEGEEVIKMIHSWGRAAIEESSRN
ncbi:hypothetical protein BC937DRAFT_90643 [Endogone sp. FLAS-F59071]|nr:hypothetical protein BC937DRAFT_90643 [Endogone sp. FLAS-F59071]|eukprot:RUS22012.1 hypothetical protein BC937DRAFT_90643 [Endogone sp. FLAS-F59071]